jgi:hypothetical protein
MNIDGGCLCGSVSFEAEIDPAQVFICHCADCQTHSGSSFRTIVRAAPGSFKITEGSIKQYAKRAESGNLRSLAFCPECGTPIYGGPGPGEEGFMSLRVGAIRQRELLQPKAQLWFRSSQPWLDGLSELPKFDTQPAARRPEPNA